MRQPMSPCLNKISSVTGTYASDKNSTICKIESVELPLYTGRTVARKMKKIVLDIQSSIHAHNMERMLMQKLDDYQIIISESPDSTAEWCRMHRPDVLLMEVKAYAPWMFNQRMAISEKVKSSTPDCRVILFVDDENDEPLNEKVRCAKREGLIDAFLFGSLPENYFVSVIDSV